MTSDDWTDALYGRLNVLLNVIEVVGLIGIVLSILLIIARSPKDPR